MRLIIAGSRSLNRSIHVGEHKMLMLKYMDMLSPVIGYVEEVVCGMAEGPDLWGRDWAKKYGIMVKEFPADWNKHGKAAGPMRNSEMVKYGTALVAFWDGKSSGTYDTIKKAVTARLSPIFVNDITIPF